MTPATSPNLTFAQATKVTPTSPNTYTANLPDDWCIGKVPHGGYITGLFMTVASTHFNTTLSSQNQPHTIALHLSFLRRTQVGPALFTVKTLKLGRQTSILSISLSQDGIEEAVCTLTQSNISIETGVSYDTKWALDPPPAKVDLQKLSADGEYGDWRIEREEEMAYKGFRKATAKCEFAFPKRGQRKPASGDEWIRMRSGEKWTNASIGYLADTWPMPVESFIAASASASGSGSVPSTPTGAGKFWYPTLLLNLDIKKSLPDEGVEWLFARVDTKQIKNGRMDIDLVILDEQGDIVALSSHVALAVGSARNTTERKKAESKL